MCSFISKEVTVSASSNSDIIPPSNDEHESQSFLKMKTYAIYVGTQRLITGYVGIESNNIYTLVKGYTFTPTQMKETQTIIIGSMKGKELYMN